MSVVSSTAVPGGRARFAAPVTVTGWATHVPGVEPAALVPWVLETPAEPADRAHELLGRKGLLGKEPATRLALCAVHRALGLPPRAARPSGPPDPRTAVVASSNLGNVATVCSVVETLRDGTLRDVSPLDIPNASSNVLASTIAIWFRLGGPNLMVCSGATSGLDAVRLGCLLLESGRADRCLVVGAEPDDEVARALHARRGGDLRAAAAALVLEGGTGAPASAPRLGPVTSDRSAAELAERLRGLAVVGPARLRGAGVEVLDTAEVVGETYGARGVLEVVVAAAMIASGRAARVAVVGGDEVDGWRLLSVSGGQTREEAS